jgi:hypothetical protein
MLRDCALLCAPSCGALQPLSASSPTGFLWVPGRPAEGFVEDAAVLCRGTEIARHGRSYGQGVFVYDSLHYWAQSRRHGRIQSDPRRQAPSLRFCALKWRQRGRARHFSHQISSIEHVETTRRHEALRLYPNLTPIAARGSCQSIENRGASAITVASFAFLRRPTLNINRRAQFMAKNGNIEQRCDVIITRHPSATFVDSVMLFRSTASRLPFSTLKDVSFPSRQNRISKHSRPSRRSVSVTSGSQSGSAGST